MYLLDTNHCAQLLRNHPEVVRRLRDLERTRVATCVVVRGELMFMARKSAQQAANVAAVNALMRDMGVFPVDEAAADGYGALKAALLDHFGPKDRARRRQFEVVRLGFSDNDLWIAAIARSRGYRVVSSDRDFVRINEVTPLPVETWWTPEDDDPSVGD